MDCVLQNGVDVGPLNCNTTGYSTSRIALIFFLYVAPKCGRNEGRPGSLWNLHGLNSERRHMAEKLKNRFLLPADVRRFTDGIADVYVEFDRDGFLARVLDGSWEDRELKARLRHLALSLGPALPEYPAALSILRRVAERSEGFMGMVFSEFVYCFGQDDPDRSLPALHEFTRYGSSEFAIRPFLARDQVTTLEVMRRWADDPNEHVRRLASEGCRPRLPWAPALSNFKKDPRPLLPILEALKDDPSGYVRRSVSNNLNDISKDHPDLVLDVAGRWLGHSAGTDWIVKRACRTMLKAGEPRAMRLFGFADPALLRVEHLTLSRRSVPIGAALRFSFELHNDATGLLLELNGRIRTELRLGFLVAHGAQRPVQLACRPLGLVGRLLLDRTAIVPVVG